jgi:hypothetical protein
MTTDAGVASATAFLASPLTTKATNDERKLFNQNRGRAIEALMHPKVLVPEGRFDAEWLGRLADVGEARQKNSPPFTTVLGVVPTENAAVVFTTKALRRLRTGLLVVVDGDTAGDQYVKELSTLPHPPEAIFQWSKDWTIEDTIAWALLPGGQAALDEVRVGLGGVWQIGTLADLTTLLRTKNDAKSKILGLKEDVIAHDVIASVLREHAACAERAAELCECLVQVALGQANRRAVSSASSTTPTFRFDSA